MRVAASLTYTSTHFGHGTEINTSAHRAAYVVRSVVVPQRCGRRSLRELELHWHRDPGAAVRYFGHCWACWLLYERAAAPKHKLYILAI